VDGKLRDRVIRWNMHELFTPARLNTRTKGDWPASPVFLCSISRSIVASNKDMTNLKRAGSLDGMSMPTIKPVSTYTTSFNEMRQAMYAGPT
jgi:hypothetical protein